MDPFNPDTWKQQWTTFMNYPYIMMTGIAITAAIVWWFRGFQTKIFEDRLKIAAEKVELADRARNEVERQFHSYKDEVATGGGNGVLAGRVANVEAAIAKLSAANNAVRSAIGIAVGVSAATGIDDSFANTPLSLLRAAQAEADKELPK